MSTHTRRAPVHLDAGLALRLASTGLGTLLVLVLVWAVMSALVGLSGGAEGMTMAPGPLPSPRPLPSP